MRLAAHTLQDTKNVLHISKPMQKTLLFCEQCYDNAVQFGEYALDTYIKICEKFALEKKAFQLHVTDRHLPVIVQFLEEKDYVISTHVYHPYILVKPKLVIEISAGVFIFCADCKRKTARHSAGILKEGE